VVSRVHSTGLQGVLSVGAYTFSNPTLINDIISANRSFVVDLTLNTLVLQGIRDLEVLGVPGATFNPQSCLFADGVGFFVAPFDTVATIAAAPDEGGNFIDVLLQPLSPTGDYHITAAALTAIDAGQDVSGISPNLAGDYDGDARPTGGGPDIGADELVP
jgi:hypothetical protein